MKSLFEALEQRLGEVTSNPRGELALFAEAVMEIPSERFSLLRLTDSLPAPTPQQEERLSELVSRRLKGEPMQYLLGYADFYGRRFSVRSGVLIPRFDTEILVDTALRFLHEGDSVLDLCAGSGCVGLTLGAELPLSVTEVEKYGDAFSVLKENAALHCSRARLVQGDVFTDSVDGIYDLIVSNPPYIPSGDLSLLSAEVQKEPQTALDGGDDGLIFYRTIIHRFTPSLKEGGMMLFECGIGQAFAVEELLRKASFRDSFRIRDYGGVERVVGARKGKEDTYV